jgi:hypothetical protein
LNLTAHIKHACPKERSAAADQASMTSMGGDEISALHADNFKDTFGQSVVRKTRRAIAGPVLGSFRNSEAR